jgi:basic amino acid/polyamine antiporter, APA family
VLPETVAKVSRSGVPYIALALMLIPALPISWFYAFNEDFYNWTLASTMVIAITFTGSAIAAAVLPWRKPEIYNASPIARYRVAGIPLITVTAIGFLVLLVFCLYKWLEDDTYALNDSGSLIYMGSLYVLALAIYVGSRLLRRRQGIDMAMVHKEIPAE